MGWLPRLVRFCQASFAGGQTASPPLARGHGARLYFFQYKLQEVVMSLNAANIEQRVLEHMHKEWGWIALRGLCALIFGLLALVMPAATLAVLVLLWGAYALVDGVLALVAGVRIREHGKPLWPLIIVGLVGIAAGIVTFFWPGVTALTLIFIIGSWAIAIGVFQIMAAIRLRKQIQGEWLHALSGLLSIVFGLLVVLRPGAGAIALTWLIGWFAICFGVLLLVLAFRLRKQPV